MRYTERGGVYFTDAAIRGYLEFCTHPANEDTSITAGTELDVMRNAGKIAYIRCAEHGRVFYTEESIKAVMEKSTHKEPPCEMFETYRKRRV